MSDVSDKMIDTRPTFPWTWLCRYRPLKETQGPKYDSKSFQLATRQEASTVDKLGDYGQFIVGLATGKGSTVVALIEDY